MFTGIELDDAEYRLKPMNCPGHILIYRDKLRSYRELPVRLGELGTVYRYERSGTMHGLLRVRGFTQDDAHIFCTPDQVEDEVVSCLEFAMDVLKAFGFTEYEAELSTWDGGKSEKYIGTREQWEHAENALKRAVERLNIKAPVIPDWMLWAASGNFPPCSSTGTCPRGSTWSTWPKTANAISR
jgi:threonyl-tRNA synthetase